MVDLPAGRPRIRWSLAGRGKYKIGEVCYQMSARGRGARNHPDDGGRDCHPPRPTDKAADLQPAGMRGRPPRASEDTQSIWHSLFCPVRMSYRSSIKILEKKSRKFSLKLNRIKSVFFSNRSGLCLAGRTRQDQFTCSALSKFTYPASRTLPPTKSSGRESTHPSRPP
jgi:hypothetical protein